jgi:hypothetical protein
MEQLEVLAEQIQVVAVVVLIVILVLAVLEVLELLLFHIQVHKEARVVQLHRLAEIQFIHLQHQEHIQDNVW